MEKEITGMMIYYLIVCKRKLWYFLHQIQMEQDNENVLIGKYLDESSYIRDDKHIEIDGVINIDFIRSKRILHEVKKSRNIEEASIWQVKYYLYYLKRKGVDNITAKIDYPLLKQTVDVILSKEDEARLISFCDEIQSFNAMASPPEEKKKNICKACAYYDLCYI